MARLKKVEEEIVEATVVDTNIYQVFDSKGDFQRDYTAVLSGDGAKEMAYEFAKSINGTVKISE